MNRQQRSISFNPGRQYLQQAIAAYLARGGTISRPVLDDTSSVPASGKNSGYADADEYLLELQ